MRYYKEVSDGYIISVGTGVGHEEITSDEYNEIIQTIRSKPSVETGYDYKLTDSLEWELVEVPVVDESETEVSANEFMAMVEGVL